ncbi:MAG: hypothetical protein AB1489_18175, partial [Acidobacteriota bacterium]
KRDQEMDKLIDEHYGIIHIAGMTYYASHLIYGVDPVAYSTLATELKERMKLKTTPLDDSKGEV